MPATPLDHALEKEPSIPRIREESTTIVPSEDHMMGMVREDAEVSRCAGHALFSVGALVRCFVAVCCVRSR